MFAFSLLWIIYGINFLIEDKAIIGRHRDLSINIIGGWLLLLIGIIFLYVTYHSLSPFGRFRRFIEGGKTKKKTGKRD